MVWAVTTDRLRWLLLAAAAVLLVVHAFTYNFITDDAYISFVYARNLAEHGELTFNPGWYIEGYTNFLWTVLLGLGMVVHIPPELTAKVLGAAFAVVTLFCAFRLVERGLGRRSPWAALPAFLLAESSGFACWTSGGLETQLFTMLVVIALDGLVAAEDPADRRALPRAGLALALAAMTRPEGLFVAAVFGGVRLVSNLLHRRERRVVGRPELLGAASFLVVWAPWFAWRYWYYGYPFPNTYYVKATGAWASPSYASQMVHAGLYYIWVWLNQTKLLFALPIVAVGLVTARTRTPRFTLCLACALLAVVYVPYTISVGGDFMGLHRFIMPLFVVAALALTLGLEWLVARLPANLQKHAGVGVAVAIAACFGISQYALTKKSLDPKNLAADHGVIDTPAFLIVYTEDRAAIGRVMESCFNDSDFSIVGGAGAQPYFGRMRAIDVFGLVSERVAHEEMRVRPRAGHTKFASNELLVQYDPTFVFSCYSIDAKPTPAHWNCSPTYWTGRGYEIVTVHVPEMRQSGTYYSFLAKKARNFQCPARVN
jgi:hypothetical protein